MKKKGRMRFVPPAVMDEIETIKKEHDLEIGTEAFRKMAKYSKVGREMEKIKKHPTRLLAQPIINMGKKKRKKWKYNDFGGVI
jgi:hypothetical protein|tara:strand:+ start:1413 stop:1661 length:249 start_codon:yes stop_codon:yes gene_type:complete